MQCRQVANTVPSNWAKQFFVSHCICVNKNRLVYWWRDLQYVLGLTLDSHSYEFLFIYWSDVGCCGWHNSNNGSVRTPSACRVLAYQKHAVNDVILAVELARIIARKWVIREYCLSFGLNSSVLINHRPQSFPMNQKHLYAIAAAETLSGSGVVRKGLLGVLLYWLKRFCRFNGVAKL